MADVSAIYHPIKHDLENVERLISTTLNQVRNPHLLEVNRYLLSAPGKRLRPVLALLAYKSFNAQASDQVCQLGAALELLHMASLVHDDIIDCAQERHHQPCVHVKYGQGIGIATGVYLYALSLQQIAQIGDITVLRRMSHAVKGLCIGEISQVFERDNFELDLIQYLIVLKRKTAVLFEVACSCGALLAGATLEQQFALKQLGYALGMLFQLSDDVMDVLATTEQLGKMSGQDFEMGELTLPFLLLIQSKVGQERQHILNLIASKDRAHLKELRDHMLASTVLQQTADLGLHYLNVAKRQLPVVQNEECRVALEKILSYVENRAFKKG